MLITNKDLQIIFDLARDEYVNGSTEGLDGQQFSAKCYTKAVLKFMKMSEGVEFEKRKFASPAEEGE